MRSIGQGSSLCLVRGVCKDTTCSGCLTPPAHSPPWIGGIPNLLGSISAGQPAVRAVGVLYRLISTSSTQALIDADTKASKMAANTQ
jgi:hypothetical protein